MKTELLEILLTTEQVASRLAIRRGTLEQWRLRKQGLPFVRLGRLIRYRECDVDEFLKCNTIEVGNV